MKCNPELSRVRGGRWENCPTELSTVQLTPQISWLGIGLEFAPSSRVPLTRTLLVVNPCWLTATYASGIEEAMLTAGGGRCRHAFSTACRHARQPLGACGFGITRSYGTMNSIDKAINAIRAAGKTKVDQNAESHVEGSSGGAVSANTSPALYSTIDINPEKKTVTTTVGELPISPLMDPSFHDARARYTRPKPTTTQYKLTKFQRKLRRSPFGESCTPEIRPPDTTSGAFIG